MKTTDWVIVIPSYKRAETLRDKTLSMLKSYKIPASRIHVFVANKEEEATYKATLDPATYGHMHIAIPGMAAVRNYITRYFPVGKPIFNLDDDIRGFLEYSATARRHEKPLSNLTSVIEKGFQKAQQTGFRLFGFYPVPNGFFMKNSCSTDLKYVIGSAWGIINPGPILTVTIDDKEDYLRTVIMYLLDGGVLRFNNVSMQSAYYKETGGMQETRTMKRIETSAKAMVAAFPDLVKINLTKKSGMPEVRLRDARAEPRFGLAALKEYTMPKL
jgi:cellulose synthase/poly-beta-1,6-N-acetylglucosamine synthase-like glycosyltransferase